MQYDLGFFDQETDRITITDVLGKDQLLNGGPWSIQAVPPVFIRIKLK
jgi:hypothetical protein